MELRYVSRRQGRLSSILRSDMGLSAGLMNRLKWKNAIAVDGVQVHTDYPVQPGQSITVLLDEPRPVYPAEPMALDILFEDDHLLAVDKPAGMLIHPSRSKITGTLANGILAYYDQTGQKSAFHPVTRLDRDTFGVTLLAKNALVHGKINELHHAGTLQKTYYAWVYGHPAESSGTVEAPIARKPLPSLLREIRPDGKPSVTEFEVLETRGGCSKLRLRPITGRTHQLRLHCAFLGCPILGDPQYFTKESQALSEKLGLESQLLCARELEFAHPFTGQRMKITSHMDVILPELA